MTIVVVRDATHENVHLLPPGHAAGYTTGSATIKWTQADWDAHPAALRICQDTGASDATADYLDVERGAATNAESPGWVKRARASFASVNRAGQRGPAIYTSASNITPLVNTLNSGGVHGGVGLVVANWNLTQPEAAAEVVAAAGPFPIVGIQFASLPSWDVNVFSSAYLHDVALHTTGYRDLVTAGKRSLGEIAVATGQKPSNILTSTVNHGGLDPVIAKYVDDVFARDSAHIPAGGTLRVRR